MKTPIRFLSQLSKIENSLGSKYLLPRKCSTSVTTLTSEKLISTPDREKITISLHSKQQKFRKYRVSQKWRTNGALRCRRDYRKRQKNVKKILLDLFSDLALLECGT
jgi:hypothetical protein